eukprot:163777-Hanusia_phi.AAC.1
MQCPVTPGLQPVTVPGHAVQGPRPRCAAARRVARGPAVQAGESKSGRAPAVCPTVGTSLAASSVAVTGPATFEV